MKFLMILKHWVGFLSKSLIKWYLEKSEKISWFIIGVIFTLGIFHLMSGNTITSCVALILIIVNYIVGKK